MTAFIHTFKIKASNANKERKKKIVTTGYTQVSNEIHRGVVFIENDEYKIQVPIDEDSNRVLSFTPDSFNIKGVAQVFLRCHSNEDKKICYIRDIWRCRIETGDPNRLVPFAPNWKVAGILVKNNETNTICFKFKHLVGVNGWKATTIIEE